MIVNCQLHVLPDGSFLASSLKMALCFILKPHKYKLKFHMPTVTKLFLTRTRSLDSLQQTLWKK